MVDGYVILDAKGADVNDITTGISIPGSHELLASAYSSGRSVIVVGLVSNDTPLAPTVAQVEKNEDDYILSGFSAKVTPEGRLVPIKEGPYTLPIATRVTLGGIIVGDGLEIDENGVLKVQSTEPPEPPAPYELPTASSSTLGGIKVGDTLNIQDGVLNTPVKLGFDAESGKYGYYKAGESVITPFEEGGGGFTPLEPIYNEIGYVYVSTDGRAYVDSLSAGPNNQTYLWEVGTDSSFIVFVRGALGNRFRGSYFNDDWSKNIPEPTATSQIIATGRSFVTLSDPTFGQSVYKGNTSQFRYVGMQLSNNGSQIEAFLIKL